METFKPSVVYFDCSSTVYTGLNTGIQRVVRNIVKRMGNLSTQLGCPCVAVVVHKGRFCRLDGRLDGVDFVEGNKKGLLEESIRNWYLKSRTLPLYRLVRKISFLNFWLVRPMESFFELIKRMIQKTLYRLRLRPIQQNLEPILFHSDSMLILSDAWWVEDVAEVAEKEKEQVDFHITTLFYDLIPVTHSQYVTRDNTRAFLEKLEIIKRISDSHIGISKFVMHEIQKHVGGSKPTDYFYLGSDFSNYRHAKSSTSGRIWPKSLLEDPFFLVVGTLEPRKGHGFLLDGFEKIWQEGGKKNLCIVGRVGWDMPDLLHRINYNPYLNNRLFVFNDLNDFELHFLYRRAKALIFGSYVEGFGLPLVEAMDSGLQIIASDIPVFREICQDYAQYFQHENLESLVKVVLNYSTMSSIKPRKWLSWDESVRILGEKLISFYNKKEALLRGFKKSRS